MSPLSNNSLSCIMPWKALYMDECNGQVCALPCCLSWITKYYGEVGTTSLKELWNSEGAQYIRHIIASGRQSEICNRHCPNWMTGHYEERAHKILDGPPLFVENQHINLQEIRERKTYLQSKPILLKVIPTLSCNLRCSMCFQKHYETLDVSPSLWAEVEDFFPYIYDIVFQGGEVTLDEGFINFMNSESLKIHNQVHLSLITNGTTLDERLIDNLSKVRIKDVIVSINAATRQTYFQISKRDFFDRVINNVSSLVRLSSSHAKGKFKVHASFVVMRSNFTELPDFVQLADNLGVELQLLQVIGNRNDQDIFTIKDQHQALRNVLRKAEQISRGMAKEQVNQIQMILDGYMGVKSLEGAA